MGITVNKNKEEDGNIAIARFPSSTKAELIKCYLESQGITCILKESIANWLWPGVLDENAVKLCVNENLYNEALKVMKEGGYEEYIIS